jgi:acetyl esterase/lipase
VFVHGGPVRQMLLGYHYMHFYHVAYAVNQWLASRGYVVMSINYRSGIGYGKSFRTAANSGGRGNAEYQDVLAGGKYLQTRPEVDANRVGIWGLSYGGVLTAQALARNSDIFKVGVDMAGVHLWGGSLDPDSVYKSTDEGVTWNPINTGLPSAPLSSLALSGSTLFVAPGGFGVYKTDNGGASWTPANNGISTQSITRLMP